MRDTLICRALNRTEVTRFNCTIDASLYNLFTAALNPGFAFVIAFAKAWNLGRRRHQRIMSQLCNHSFDLKHQKSSAGQLKNQLKRLFIHSKKT